ncbi:uncharacterized protein LACBIDRAFT_307071 [Laccaria bicolor S238N-H82]|uniref:Predicted protein n=1 Tax=Laccaria bicolor (strain S238N-H82 / ATCC MYA-4686) TaxID=486041 RepID=B0DPB1_LACBS|nr:uncharacterized protein LACBIDRAFT_307071 [Laccaria bicolor S238N-H82]EDR03584.1 predicted protein [Laccaria bicolor S238N-H82]|eukprot:XP_001885732.1 predicted protein [Laccaria bicolor S238N-H82]
MSTSPGHDHTSTSLDGKGGTDSAAKVGKSTGPSYVYYRLYTKLGAFESNQPLYHNDRFIGRIPLKSVAPPRTVASLKRCLCKLEGLSEPDKALVFTPLSSPAPKEDSARLSFHAPSGPGLSEQDPIALVVESEKRIEEITQSDKLPERSDDTDIHYVYYRVYSSEGDEKAKTSFDETDSSLGRINSLSVAPPHNAGSLKACIAKFEGLVNALYMELFQDVDSDAAMGDTDVISFQGDTYPGSNQGNPVAAIAAFTKRARLLFTCSYKQNKPTWLSINKDEIIHTDGVIVSVRSPSTNQFCLGYMVINSKDEKGCESPICLWVAGWLLIFFCSCARGLC